MNNHYVYQLRREDSELPFYVGNGKGARNVAHFTKTSLKDRNRKNSSIKSTLAEGVKVLSEKLYENLDEELALLVEMELIRKFGRRDKGTGILTNMTDGGEGMSGQVKSAEERAAISERNRLRKITDETRAKISKSNSVRVVSEATRLKMSVAGLGGPAHTAEAKAKMSASHKALPKLSCPHCGKQMMAQHLKRWHGDNCKERIQIEDHSTCHY